MKAFEKLKQQLFGAPRVYADYAAATPASPEAAEAAARVLSVLRGNPSSPHEEGRAARALLEDARRRASRVLSAHADELIFTSGGTESNNLAILGAARIAGVRRPHLITSVIEHGSVLEPLRRLEAEGAALTVLPVDAEGHISHSALKEALTPETVLVSLAYANGEIGAVEKIRDAARILAEYRASLDRPAKSAPYFHTDASQAALYLSVHPGDLGVDLLSLDGLKIYGLPGSGVLYVRRGLELEPIFYGGGQERGMRSGTENVPAAAALAEALERAALSRKEEAARIRELSRYFLERISVLLPQALVNSDPEGGLPHIVNLSFPGLDAEFAAVKLDALGISASSASACRSIGANGASYVLEALPGKAGHGSSSLRFSFGRSTSKTSIDRILAALLQVIAS